MRRPLALAGGLAAAALGPLAPVIFGQASAELVRCRQASDIACLRTALTLSWQEAGTVAAVDSAVEPQYWAGRLSHIRLIGPNVYDLGTVGQPLRLLVLLDVSGSMRGAGIAVARSTLKSFVTALPTDEVRVAVAPFESRQVAPAIQGAGFVPPRKAFEQLGQIPGPRPNANTALYTALVEGARAVTASVQDAAPKVRGALLVITDGRNDVGHHGDDPGLLAGPDGRRAAARAVAQKDLKLWIIGVGDSVDQAELASLAGAGAELYILKLDPNLLARRFRIIQRQVRASRELDYGLTPGGMVSLARVALRGTSQFGADLDGEAAVSNPFRWQPPRIALPVFQGVLNSARLSPAFRGLLDVLEPPGQRRWYWLALLAAVWVALWSLVPRLVWVPAAIAPVSEVVLAEPAVAPRAKPTQAPSVVTPAGGLRRDVEEAPPRSPTEVTASFRKVNGTP